MALTDEARAENRHAGTRCSITMLTEKYPDLADELAEALADPTLSGAAIARALRNRYGDEGPTDNTLNRHRHRQCHCD